MTSQTKCESVHKLPATANEVSCEVSFLWLLMRVRKHHILKLMALTERYADTADLKQLAFNGRVESLDHYKVSKPQSSLLMIDTDLENIQNATSLLERYFAVFFSIQSVSLDCLTNSMSRILKFRVPVLLSPVSEMRTPCGFSDRDLLTWC